jgi:flagellar biosynthesis GTPase FlhF
MVSGLKAPSDVLRTLARMVSADPEQRYPDADQLRRSLSRTERMVPAPLIRLIVTNKAQSKLFENGLITNSTIAEAVDYIGNQLNIEERRHFLAILEDDRRITILTDEIRLLCRRDAENDGRLVILDVQVPYAPNLESQKAMAASVAFEWEVLSSREAKFASEEDCLDSLKAINDLFDQLNTHKTSRTAAKERRDDRKDFVSTWELVLRYQERVLNEAASLEYVRVEEEDETVTFTLREASGDGLGWRENAALAVVTDDDQRPIPVGSLLAIKGETVEIARDSGGVHRRRGSRKQLPRSGRLILFRPEERASLRRQNHALLDLRDGMTANPRLADVLLDVSRAEFDVLQEDLSFIQADLAPDKQEAVRWALAARDIFLLQGPPGTGKTTTIAELILQILREKPNARILVSSQSNVAVNHVISRVAGEHDGPRLEIMRLGREEKIRHGAEQWTLPRRLERWRDDVVARCGEVLKELEAEARRWRKEGSKATASLNAIALDNCQGWLDEAQELVEAFQRDEERRAALLASLKAVEISDLSADEGDTIRDELVAAEASLAEQRKTVAEHLQVIRELLPPNLAGIPLSDPSDELNRLRDAVARAQEAGDPSDPTKDFRAIVRQWRDVFGLTEDFAKPLMERANILAATCLYAGGVQFRGMEFDWAIIDEAGRATAPEVLVALVRARRVVMVGDERQLPPMLDEELSPQKLQAAGFTREGLETSLFETLVHDALERRPEAVRMLTVQHRMHPAIGRLISHVFYEGRLEHGVTLEERLHGLDWVPRPVVWVTTAMIANKEETRRGSSFDNPVEASEISRSLRLMEQTYRKLGQRREVGVIAGYSAQVEYLSAELQPSDGSRWQALDIEISTVDAFQGRDRDIVLYSAVRSNRQGNLGFLRDWRRLNVALSRARELLVIVGDSATLDSGSSRNSENRFPAILRYIRDHTDDCALVPAGRLGS